jgi:hypothetical protein
MHKNSSSSSNSSSPSCTPFFKHMFTNTTVGRANANTLTRLYCSNHETATASTQTCAPLILHHTTGKQSPSSNVSNGQGHKQAPQQQATNQKPEIQRSMEPFSSQQIWAIGKWHQRMYQKPYQHYPVHLPTQGAGRPHERCHIWVVFIHNQTRKGRNQPNAIYGRG